MKKKFSEIVSEERVEAQRQSRQDNIILTVMMAFMGLVIVGGFAFNYFWDDGDTPKKTVSSFEKANTSGADGAEVSLMESNCIESVREITELPGAVVAEILYKDFPWAGDVHVATEFVADGFASTEMKIVLEQSPKMPFICKSLNISGTDIEVTYQK